MSPRRRRAARSEPKLSLEHRQKIANSRRLVSDRDRFETFIGAPDANGCWPWLGKRVKGDRRSNSGHFRLGSRVDGSRRLVQAHVYSYQEYVGPVAAGLVVRHRCDTPTCVNPAHLELGTQLDNVRDMVERGRAHWQRQAAGGAA